MKKIIFIIFTVLFSMTVYSEATLITGKSIAFDRKKGNCLACHQIDKGELYGNVAPPLVNMKTRYPDKKQLRIKIWDATASNPESMMPPFGKHGILTEDEIDQLVDYIYQL